MQERTHAGYGHVLRGDLEIPKEVASSKALNLQVTSTLSAFDLKDNVLVMFSYHARSGSVAPQPTPPIHLMSLLILEDHPQSSCVDEESLDHGYPMNVPIESRALVETSVSLWTDKFRNGRRQNMKNKVISKKPQ
jgi:hypothetical protein